MSCQACQGEICGCSAAPLRAEDLIAFEDRVAAAMAAGEIHTPTHLCGGNEAALIEIFRAVGREDWIFATYRNHYHALLSGVPADEVFREIVAGRSMTPRYAGRKFFTSAIVGGCLPIAVGAAAALKRRGSRAHVWCFVGDMAATGGAFHEATCYAAGHQLPVTFVVEDNGLACDTPTREVWGTKLAQVWSPNVIRYEYARTRAHLGAKQ